MPEIIDIEDPTAQPDPEEVDQNVPEGMRITTYPERATSFAANIAGGLAGLSEATAEGVYDVATAPLRALDIMEGDVIPEGYKEAYKGSKAMVSERLDKDFIDNLGKNLSDLLEGFVTIISSPFNVQEFVPEDKTFFDVVVDQTEKAYGTTEDLHEIVYADMTNLMNPANLIENVRTRPVDLGLVMLPTVRAIKNLGKAGVIKTAQAGGKVEPLAKSVIKTAEKLDGKLTEYMAPVINSSFYSALKRWISDPSAQTTPELQDVARRFLNEPPEARARFDAAFEEAAQRIVADEAAGVATPTKPTKTLKPERQVRETGEVGQFQETETALERIAREELAAVREERGPATLLAVPDNVDTVAVLDRVRRAFLAEGSANIINDPQLAIPGIMDVFLDASTGPAAAATIQLTTAIRNAIRPYLARVLESPAGFKQLAARIKELVPDKKVANNIIDDLKQWRETNKDLMPKDKSFPSYTVAEDLTISTSKLLEDIASTDRVVNASIAEEVFSTIARELGPMVETQSFKYIVDDLMKGTQGDVFIPPKPTQRSLPARPALTLVGEAPSLSIADILSDLMSPKTETVPIAPLREVDAPFGQPITEAPQIVGRQTRRTREVAHAPEYPVLYSTPDGVSKANFQRVKQQLQLRKEALIDEVAQRTGRSIDEISVEMDALAKQMKDMVPINKDAAELLGYRAGDVMIPKGLNSTLKWQNKAMNVMHGDSWLARFNRMIKRNLVVLNPSSHINNIMSNLFMLTLRDANPLTMGQMASKLKRYNQYLKGNLEGLSPDDIIAFQELRKTNLIDSSLVDIDLSMGRGKSLDIPGTKRINKALTKGFKLGDTVFKLQLFVNEFKKLTKALEVMLDGESITIMPRKGKKVELVKRGATMTIDGKPLRIDQVNKLLGESASQIAKNFLFDYSDVGNFAKMLRSVPALGILSPFYIWFLKSMDIPGFQKGLLGHTTASSSVPWVATNSPKLNMVAAKGDSILAFRRAAIVSGLKSSLAEEEDFKEILDWLPKELGTHLIDVTLDPGYAKTRNFRWMNPYEGTYQMLDGLAGMYKLGVDAVANTYTPSTLHLDQTIKEIKADPDISEGEKLDIIRMRNWWHRWHSGKGQDMGTAANILGMAGSYFFDMLDAVKISEKQGIDFDAGKFARTLGSVMMGGVYSKALRAALGLTDLKDVDGFKQSIGRWPLSPEVEQENDLRWFVRTLTGQLLKKRDLWRSYEYFFKGIRKEYQASIIQPIWDRAEALENAGKVDEADRLDAIADKWLTAINNDLEAIEEEYAAQIESLKHKDIK